MTILDKIWNFLGLVDSDDVEENPKTATEKTAAASERKVERVTKGSDDAKPRRNAQPETTTPVAASQSVLLKPNPSPQVFRDTVNGNGTVIITQPTSFDDARQIAENVKNGKTVIVNFERTDGETTKRTVDFMSGITYAVGGTVQRISSTIFLFASARVEVWSSERLGEDGAGLLSGRRS